MVDGRVPGEAGHDQPQRGHDVEYQVVVEREGAAAALDGGREQRGPHGGAEHARHGRHHRRYPVQLAELLGRGSLVD